MEQVKNSLYEDFADIHKAIEEKVQILEEKLKLESNQIKLKEAITLLIEYKEDADSILNTIKLIEEKYQSIKNDEYILKAIENASNTCKSILEYILTFNHEMHTHNTSIKFKMNIRLKYKIRLHEILTVLNEKFYRETISQAFKLVPNKHKVDNLKKILTSYLYNSLLSNTLILEIISIEGQNIDNLNLLKELDNFKENLNSSYNDLKLYTTLIELHNKGLKNISIILAKINNDRLLSISLVVHKNISINAISAVTLVIKHMIDEFHKENDYSKQIKILLLNEMKKNMEEVLKNYQDKRKEKIEKRRNKSKKECSIQ